MTRAGSEPIPGDGVLSVPFLLRLRRLFGTWRAPGIALAVFAAMFALPSFMIGPALVGGEGDGSPDAPTDTHEEHHR